MALTATVYHIWVIRNLVIFENVKPYVGSIIYRIKTFVYRVIFALYPYVLVQYCYRHLCSMPHGLGVVQ